MCVNTGLHAGSVGKLQLQQILGSMAGPLKQPFCVDQATVIILTLAPRTCADVALCTGTGSETMNLCLTPTTLDRHSAHGEASGRVYIAGSTNAKD